MECSYHMFFRHTLAPIRVNRVDVISVDVCCCRCPLCPLSISNCPSPVVFLRSLSRRCSVSPLPLYLPSHFPFALPVVHLLPSQPVCPSLLCPLCLRSSRFCLSLLPTTSLILSISLCLSVCRYLSPRSASFSSCCLLRLTLCPSPFSTFHQFTFCIHSHTYNYTHTYPSPFYKLF